MEFAIPDPQHHHQQQQISLKPRKEKTLFLEDYLSFLQSRDHRKLTVNQLNKVMAIHGFKQLPRKKKEVEEGVEAMKEKLIDPSRSTTTTLEDNISSPSSHKAVITVEEAIKDLTALNWKQCSITSIKSIGATAAAAAAAAAAPVTKTSTESGMNLKKANRSRSRSRSRSPPSLSSSSAQSKSGSCGGGGGSSSMVSGGSGEVRRKRKTIKRLLL